MYISTNHITELRKNVILALVGIIFIILAGRLYYLQIIRGPRYRDIAEANRVRVIPIEAPRGIIYDRYGLVLLDNKSQYNINVIPYELAHSPQADSCLARLLNLKREQLTQRIKNKWLGPFVPITIAADVDLNTVMQIEEQRLDLPGVIYSILPSRFSPSGVRLSQVLGYVREIDREVLKQVEQLGYKKGDLIGWRGVERQYEYILRGNRGYNFIQVDALGREVSALHDRQDILPEPGNDLYLTIDRDLQILIESLMEKVKGAAVVMDANSGEIYALVSKPDYSPELFSGVISGEAWEQLRQDPDLPLFNRATQGTYPPGSTFKIIAVITALEKKVVDLDWSVTCNGQYRLGRRIFKCWDEKGHGRMNLHEAIVHSCNVFFYNLIRKEELEEWAATAKLFHFGQPTGIDLPNEAAGVIPDVAFLDRKYGVGRWTDGNKLNLVIGQGDVLATPLQMVRFCAALATRGKLIRPHVGLKYFDRKTEQLNYFRFPADSITTISPASWDFVEKAMFDVVDRGTGRAAKVKDTFVAGKTGTAQNPHGEAHAWFIGYLRQPHRTIALTILVEHGKSGGGIAAQIAGKIFNFINQKSEHPYVLANQ
jgi:penicillin-binding protein 2